MSSLDGANSKSSFHHIYDIWRSKQHQKGSGFGIWAYWQNGNVLAPAMWNTFDCFLRINEVYKVETQEYDSFIFVVSHWANKPRESCQVSYFNWYICLWIQRLSHIYSNGENEIEKMSHKMSLCLPRRIGHREETHFVPLANVAGADDTNHIFFKGENSKIKCGVSLVTPHWVGIVWPKA